MAGTRTDGVPIAGILGDQQAALMGQACFAPGEAKNTYGTGCFLLMNTGETPVAVDQRPGHHRRLATWRAKAVLRTGRFHRRHRRAGAVAARQSRADQRRAPRSRRWRPRSPTTATCTSCPAFSGLYAPYWRADARGVIAGLTRYATAGHIARAALEATAYQTLDVIEAMQRDCRHPDQHAARRWRHGGERAADAVPGRHPGRAGACARARSRPPRSAPPTRPGLAVGYWHDTDDLARNWGMTRTWTPAMEPDRRAAMIASWHKAVSRSFDWV